MSARFKTPRELLRLTLVFSVVSSLAVLAVPLLSAEKRAGISHSVIVPLVFWAGLVLEQLAFYKFKKTLGGSVYNEKEKKNFPGAVAFFKTDEGKKADIVLIISLVLFVLFAAVQKSESIIQYILFFVAVLSFRFHAVFNGRSYRLMKRKIKTDKKSKRKDKEENIGE